MITCAVPLCKCCQCLGDTQPSLRRSRGSYPASESLTCGPSFTIAPRCCRAEAEDLTRVSFQSPRHRTVGRPLSALLLLLNHPFGLEPSKTFSEVCLYSVIDPVGTASARLKMGACSLSAVERLINAEGTLSASQNDCRIELRECCTVQKDRSSVWVLDKEDQR